MVKPLWALTGVALLSIAGAAGGVIVASPGGEEEAAQHVSSPTPRVTADVEPTATVITTSAEPPTESLATCDSARIAPPNDQVWRWGDVTVTIPKGNGVRVMGDIHDGRPVLVIFPEADSDEWTVIDAATGVLGPIRPDDDPQREKEAEIQQAVATVEVCAFDPAKAQWPYNGEPATPERDTSAGLSYLVPDPGTGIQITYATTRCSGDCPGSGESIVAETSRSQMGVVLRGGEIVASTSEIDPVDQEAFSRYLQTIQVVDP